MCSLGKTLLAFGLLHSVRQGQIYLLFQVFLDFLLLHSSPLQWKGHLFWLLVLEGLVGLHRIIQLQLLQHYWLVHSLVAQMVKRLPAVLDTQVRSLDWEDPLEKEMATHSSTLAWKISWTEDFGRL